MEVFARRQQVEVTGHIMPEVYLFAAWCPGFNQWIDNGEGLVFDASRVHVEEWNKRYGDKWPIVDKDGSIERLYIKVADVVEWIRKTSLKDPSRPLWKHQSRALNVAMCRPYYGFFHDMGTGKSCTAFTIAAEKFMNGDCDQVLYITTKKGMTQSRDIQLPLHMPPEVKYRAALMPTPKGDKLFEYPKGSLCIAIASPGAFQSKKQTALLRKWCCKRKTLIIVDESQNFKGWSAQRLDNLLTLKPCSTERYLFSGEPNPNGYIDLFAQFFFMDEQILGHSTISSFEKMFCIKGGHETKQIVDYKNVNELTRLIAPHCEFVGIDDCLDMPQRVWEECKYTMTDEQRVLYRRVALEFIAEAERANNEGDVTVVKRICKNAASKFTALQQVGNGWFYANPDEDGNKGELYNITDERAEFTLDVVIGASKKVVVWARFHEDLAMLTRVFEANKVEAVEFSGRVSDKQCDLNKFRFIEDTKCKVFYGTAASGGTALDGLQVATRMGYFSNTFNWNDRRQSERRIWRAGQENKVWYGDVIGNSADRNILQNAAKKENLSDTLHKVTKLAQLAMELKKEIDA